ncbi:hypothetical protein KVV02_003979 [Mortierella alpina]|uniref:CBF1-interacting co-repressor CIR N-terminal domain-containing protein n=1 Tax=Mortierella alpina TaxID=64518 RepID=A0A9P8A1C9_MORAP|nr:hypothetical protein KVV02_003979 [Mortierella alpina]
MNILPHKSWHVYSQKNRDKVRRDEAKAEDEQRQVQDRSIAADREHRLMLLRERAQKRQSNAIGGDSTEKEHSQTDRGSPVAEDTMALVRLQNPSEKTQHVNFWADLEKQDTKSKQGNPEREAEDKRKQEKWDRTIAMHLDSGVKGPKPWYTSLHAGSMQSSRRRGDDKEFTKVREDPLSNMKVMLDKRDKAHRERSKSPTSKSRSRLPGVSKRINSVGYRGLVPLFPGD